VDLSKKSLIQLLPPGDAWPRRLTSNLATLLEALGLEFDRAEARIGDALKARDPRDLDETARDAWEATGLVFGLGWGEPDAADYIDANVLDLDGLYGDLAVANLRSHKALTIAGIAELVDNLPWTITLIDAETTAALEVTVAVDAPDYDAIAYLFLALIQQLYASVNLTYEYAPVFEEAATIVNVTNPGVIPVPGDTVEVQWTHDANPAVFGFTYRWQRDGVNISGETLTQYTVDVADSGTDLTASVALINTHGNRTSVSAPVSIP
jgi:hypothetical protein